MRPASAIAAAELAWTGLRVVRDAIRADRIEEAQMLLAAMQIAALTSWPREVSGWALTKICELQAQVSLITDQNNANEVA